MFVFLGILFFGILIFTHELGHFLAAKAFSVRVEEFSMGMGPTLWKRRRGDTLYSLRLLPIGGFCAMEGENEATGQPGSFSDQAWWKRVIILMAGAAMNFALGFLLTAVIYSGADAFSTNELIGFETNCPYEGDIQTGDRIVKINGERVYYLSNFTAYCAPDEKGTVDLVLRRGAKRLVLNDYPLVPVDYTLSDGSVVHKYGLNFKVEEANALSVLRYSWYSCMDFVRMVRQSLAMLFTGQAGLRDITGVVGIVDTINETGQSAASVGEGVLDVLYLIAFIAVNLAVMNLLPLPALDGGHVVTILLSVAAEAVIGRRPDPKVENYIHTGGLVLLMGLMVFLIFNDVLRIILP